MRMMFTLWTATEEDLLLAWWTAIDAIRDPYSRMCCSGVDCGCQGVTWREWFALELAAQKNALRITRQV